MFSTLEPRSFACAMLEILPGLAILKYDCEMFRSYKLYRNDIVSNEPSFLDL
jgi:hypothetical protein